jgi:sugar phosphate isomerase/epimerase
LALRSPLCKKRRGSCIDDAPKTENNPVMTRRHLLVSAMAMLAVPDAVRSALAGRRLGMVINSFTHRWRTRNSSVKYRPFLDVLDAMDYLRDFGTGSLQVGLDGMTLDLAHQARATSESYDMRLEGVLRLPRSRGELDGFMSDIRLGKEAGMTLFRIAAGGRRYEIFTSRAAFEEWLAATRRSLEMAESAARRLDVRLAVENHKDFELHELLSILQTISSPHLGACLDTGNSLALLEDPMEVVRQLAPYTFTVHFKDIAVCPAEDGFHMSEVPLGKGIFDLPAMISIITHNAPQARFHLEMITRDPLHIPCLKEGYWASFPEKPGLQLTRTLQLVKTRATASLPRITGLSAEAVAAREEQNVLDCLAAASTSLGFSQIVIKVAKGDAK